MVRFARFVVKVVLAGGPLLPRFLCSGGGQAGAKFEEIEGNYEGNPGYLAVESNEDDVFLVRSMFLQCFLT